MSVSVSTHPKMPLTSIDAVAERMRALDPAAMETVRLAMINARVMFCFAAAVLVMGVLTAGYVVFHSAALDP